MHPSRIFKTVHEFSLSIAFVIFILNSLLQFRPSTGVLESLLWAILCQLILMDKKEWYASDDPKQDSGNYDGWWM